MQFRSLLFVPGDRPDRFPKAMASATDALILDLEDSVSPGNKEAAREAVNQSLQAERIKPVLVRVNPRPSGLMEADLQAVLASGPDGIVLPKAEGAADIAYVLELMGDKTVPILPIATETPAALFEMGSYREVSAHLCGLTWGAEDLPAATGASTAREEDGRYTPPYEWVRSLALFGAHAAGVQAIETVFPDIRNVDGLSAYASRARRDGFTAMMAIHPAQCEPINQAFTPTPEEIQAARAIVEAFEAQPNAGVLQVNGKMVDAPHLHQARNVLSLAGAAET
ncbi:HpcH/HpaI aldolase/citrate lyase family protein [Henriciella aquimarina]|uniref:HpcH/HpaI aldolase/citrate lyase family protein n=1 Tax=Henriciella aquimarina TaxID=545261 RepID=UPI000A07312A|nr:CoA ester lyase [Henriciella aquimarina]